MSGPATFQAYPTGSPLNSYTNIILAAYTNLTPATNFSVTNLSVTNLAFVTNGTVLTTNLTVRITNSMTFDAVAGVTYLIAVDGGSFGFTPNQNVFDFSWTSTISTNAGQFQMGPITDAASTYRGYGGSQGGFSGVTNVYAVTELETYWTWGGLTYLFDPLGAVITVTQIGRAHV